MSIIRVVDVETTGKEPPAEVCEIGWSDYNTETGDITLPNSRLHRVETMPADVRAVHHITLEETLNKQSFGATEFVRQSLDAGVAAFAAHNMAFEALWLGEAVTAAGMLMVCTYKAALRVWPDAPAHNNGTIRYWLEDVDKVPQLGRLAEPSHRAGPDAYVTAYILKALFDHGVTGSQLVAWTKQPALFPTCPIGDHRGKPWADVPFGFLDWMTRKAKDMDPDLIWNAQRELDRRDAETRSGLEDKARSMDMNFGVPK